MHIAPRIVVYRCPMAVGQLLPNVCPLLPIVAHCPPWSAMIYLSTDCGILPLTALNAFVFTQA